ncbi:MAG: response regulator transcription factor [Miltoncostaeaceae bacterium]
MIRIVLADDNPGFRRALRRLLEREGDMTIVAEVGDGEVAVATAVELAPDVVVMDLAMPGLNGLDASNDIRRLNPGIAVLLLSVGETAGPDAATEAGVGAHLFKGVPASEIVSAVRSLSLAHRA